MKILMTTMSLGIGGAETHIAELSKGLCGMGHDITVASGGGVFVESLEKAGVKHVTLPLYSKKPIDVIRCYRGLKKLIAQEHFDVVHAHARIPAAICGILAKRMGFRFATTAHYNFKVSPIWRWASNWGERSLAVSYDLKEYLIKNYDVPSDNISLTVNGIDIDRFSADAPHDGIVKEFDLPKSEHRVLYVSRLDRSCVQAGFDLIDATRKLAPRYPDMTVVMVGAGDVQERVRTMADEVNRALGREAIVLAGARTDIDCFCGWANYFVGVSRSALEAMSAGCPTVLAGAQGSLGIFREETLARALDTNFTCRGYPLMDGGAIADALAELFEMSEEERVRMGAYNRAVVAKHYSITRMAQDAEAVYRSLSPYEPYQCGEYLLNGYYGFGNTGDDSLLQVIISQIKESDPEAKITVLAKSPKRVQRATCTRCINRFNIFKVRSELRSAKVLVYGGGSLLQSATSSRSLVYYCYILRMAQKMGVKTMLYANGIGPFLSKKDERRAKEVLDKIDCITLRDKASFETLKKIGVENSCVCQASDAAFANIPGDARWCAQLLANAGLGHGQKYFAVSVRKFKDMDPDFVNKLARSCNEIAEKYSLRPVFVSMQAKKDLALCEALCRKTNGVCIKGLSPSEVHTIIAGAQAVVGMRLHLLIYAAACAVPVVGISYDPKVDALFRELESDRLIYASSVDPDRLCALFDLAINDDRDRLEQTAAKLREKSLISIEKLKELIKE